MAEDQGLIDKGAVAGEALADFLASLAGKPLREVEGILRELTAKLTGTDSPIPGPLKSVVNPTLVMLGNAVALVPSTLADVAEGADRALTGDK